MRAIVIEKFGGPDSLVYKELPEPEPMPGHVVIEVEAFGINWCTGWERCTSSVSSDANPADCAMPSTTRIFAA